MGKSILINDLKLSELDRSFELVFPTQWLPAAHWTSRVSVIWGACYNRVPGFPLYLLYQHWGDATLETIFVSIFGDSDIIHVWKPWIQAFSFYSQFKSSPPREVIDLRPPGLEVEFSGSVEGSFHYPSLIQKPRHVWGQEREVVNQQQPERQLCWKSYIRETSN